MNEKQIQAAIQTALNSQPQRRNRNNWDKFFITIGQFTTAAAIAGSAFYLGQIFQAPARAEYTVTEKPKNPIAEDTASTAAKPQENLENENGALTTFFNSPAFNSRGKHIGTVHEAISRYGCARYYKPLCDTAESLGWKWEVQP